MRKIGRCKVSFIECFFSKSQLKVRIMASERPSYIEYVVALLEKALSPTSIVKQNVWLPVLARPDERRQCDVVIENQSGPRATFELVEVQARKRKLGSHDFQAFVDKARELGATRLICVSTAGFTGPIFNRARTLGYFVSLVHLNSWDIGVWPEQFAFKHFDITTRKVTAIKNYGFYWRCGISSPNATSKATPCASMLRAADVAA